MKNYYRPVRYTGQSDGLFKMMIVDQLVVQHQTLRNKATEHPEAVDMNELLALMDQVRAASAYIENPPQREQLSAILYHWNGYVHEKTGAYPGTQLIPYATPVAAPQPEPPAQPAPVTPSALAVVLPHLNWLLWLLAIILVVGGASLVLWPLLSGDDPASAAEMPMDLETLATAVAATQTTIAANATATRATIVQTAEAAARLFSPSATPGSAPPPPDATLPAGPVTYVVRAGDTLFSLARLFNTTPHDIMIMNNLTSEALVVGQTLVLPNPPLTPLDSTAVAPPATPVLGPGEQLVEVVVRPQTADLRSGPSTQFSAIIPLARGDFAYAIGRSQDGAWYLVQLEDGLTRGWLAATDIGLLYPAMPEIIPIIITP